MRRLAAAAALLPLLAAAPLVLFAGERMTSASNDMTRNEVGVFSPNRRNPAFH